MWFAVFLFPALIAPSGMLLPVVFTHDAILGCLIQIQNTRTCTFISQPLHTTWELIRNIHINIIKLKKDLLEVLMSYEKPKTNFTFF